MSYSLYLIRGQNYMEEEEPITIQDVEQIINQLPEGFHINRTGSVSVTTPKGETVTAFVGDYLEYYDGEKEESRVCIYFLEDCPEFSVINEEALHPIFDLADALEAKIQGEEMEVYTRQGVQYI